MGWRNLRLTLEAMVDKKMQEIELNAALNASMIESIEAMINRNLQSYTENLEQKLSNLINKRTDVLFPKHSCAEAVKPEGPDRIAHLVSPLSGNAFNAFCMADPKGEGKVWTIIQRRINGSVDFSRDWLQYKNGFGDTDSEYWLGLEVIRELTANQSHELWIEMEDMEGERRYAKYKWFAVEDEHLLYKLLFAGYNGNAGDSLNIHNGTLFVTYDKYAGNSYKLAAVQSKGGWWYNRVGRNWCNPNGLYGSLAFEQGISWRSWHGDRYSLKYVHMAIRPV